MCDGLEPKRAPTVTPRPLSPACTPPLKSRLDALGSLRLRCSALELAALGHYCPVASTAPRQCPAGTQGRSARLAELEFCSKCPQTQSSSAGSATCDFCEAGYFAAVAGAAIAGAASARACEVCLSGATCAVNTTLADVNVSHGHWRLSANSRIISLCKVADDGSGFTPCIGGRVPGGIHRRQGHARRLQIEGLEGAEGGSGYCIAGHEGPLCEVCTSTVEHFSTASARCIECPEVSSTFASIGWACLGLVALFLAINLFLRRCPSKYRQPVKRSFHLVWLKLNGVALVPKCKIILAFFQSVVVLPTVYSVHLPTKYYAWLNWLHIEWSQFISPTACNADGFYEELFLTGMVPLVLLAAIVLISIFAKYLTDIYALCCSAFCGSQRRRSSDRTGGTAQASLLTKAVLNALPWVLFISFCICSSISSAIFKAWDCVEYSDDAAANVTRAYLRSFPKMECWVTVNGVSTSTQDYQVVTNLAIIYMVVWPVGLPLLYLLLLAPQRKVLREHKSSLMRRATAFLHREYEPKYYLWEPIFMWQRLIIVGFMQLIPPTFHYFRMLIGTLVTVAYLVLIMLVKPYKRDDVYLSDRTERTGRLQCLLFWSLVAALVLMRAIVGVHVDR